MTYQVPDKYVFSDNKQLVDAVDYIQNHVPVDPQTDFDKIYPDGAVYMSTSDVSNHPDNLFGGDWVWLGDRTVGPYELQLVNVYQKRSQAYAYYSICDGCLLFFRGLIGQYENEQHVRVPDILLDEGYDKKYDHGIIFTDFEDTDNLDGPPWYRYEIDGNRIVNNIDWIYCYDHIHPKSTIRFFADMNPSDIEVNGVLDTSNTLYMDEMFANCPGTRLIVEFIDTSSVQSANGMFAYTASGSNSLNEIDINSSWDMSHLDDETGADMFLNRTNLPNFTSSDVSYRKAVPTTEGGYLTVTL